MVRCRTSARIIRCHWNACDGPASAFDFGHIVGGTESGLDLLSGPSMRYNPSVAFWW
ncbi:hypothetical protein [Stieleria varia]|uniref:Uncharacterized protein n=1 Tax=Stieleria varia TaxID=2528005 RepID=A0A5C5ZQ28_9BACT|nr:hypothetical protein [Stieleria varia]TWT89594.1 hypothetical protein Pla52n_67210 [Stieleria varia]